MAEVDFPHCGRASKTAGFTSRSALLLEPFRILKPRKEQPHGHPHPPSRSDHGAIQQIAMSGVISPDLGLAAPGGASFNPLKRRNTQIPEHAAEHPTPTSATTGHGTTYRMDPMMTEHLALIGFAARLGTSLTSDAAEASATRNDAQLLMGMLSSRHGHKPTSSDECAGRPPLDEACCGKFMPPARLSVLIVFFPCGGHMFWIVLFHDTSYAGIFCGDESIPTPSCH